MFDRATQNRQKSAVKVRLALAGQQPVDAFVYLRLDERLIDLLNDQRSFIPIRREDGSMMIIAKTAIVSVIESGALEEPPFAQAEIEVVQLKSEDEEPPAAAEPRAQRPRRQLDPYEILRVSRDASIEEIKKAYKARIKAVHPDAVAALDLDADLTRAAIISTQKINHAYDRILKDRQSAEETASAAGDAA